MKYKAIFFDIDDTVFDYEASAHIAMGEACADMGIEFKEEYFRGFMHADTKFWNMQKAGILTISEVMDRRADETARVMGIPERADEFRDIFLIKMRTPAVPIDGAEDIIRYAHGMGYRLCTASNGFLIMQTSRLKNSGLSQYFSDIFVSDDLGYEKPDPRFLYEALSRCGLSAADVLMVGDSRETDIKVAESAGMDCCWFDRLKTGDTAGNFTVTALSQLKNYI